MTVPRTWKLEGVELANLSIGNRTTSGPKLAHGESVQVVALDDVIAELREMHGETRPAHRRERDTLLFAADHLLSRFGGDRV